MTRKILHLDLDAFFCAVEELLVPTLAGKPIAVGGKPHERGVISSCSYPARAYGVRSAMPTAHALNLCPNLIVLPPRHAEYRQFSKRVMKILARRTYLIEQISVDEAFLDLSASSDTVEELARITQKEVNEELSLPCSLGAATNKLVAKIANDFGKMAVIKSHHHKPIPPNAITIVQPGEEAQFLAPLPVEALWGVGPKTAGRLADLGVKTIGDLAQWQTSELIYIFGKNGYSLSQHSKGIDDRPLVTHHETKSISQEITFARDINDGEYLRATLQGLGEKVCKRLRKANRLAATVKLKLRWPDFTTLSRQATLSNPTDQEEAIISTGMELFDKLWKPGRAVRLIGIGVSGLTLPIRQLTLWDNIKDDDPADKQALQTALSSLRDRFGENIIKRAADLDESD